MDEHSRPAPDWHTLPVTEALKLQNADANGLGTDEAAQRLARHGPNRLPEAPRRSALARLIAQFHNLLIYVLLVAAFVTALLGEWTDTSVILAVVLVKSPHHRARGRSLDGHWGRPQGGARRVAANL